jgi:HEAT repeat protein
MDEATRKVIDQNVSHLGTEKSPQAVLGLEAVGPAAIPAVTHALTSGDFDTQRDSLEVLRRLGSPGASDAILAYWKKKPAKELVPLALGALAATGTSDALRTITELMSSEDFDLADAAADAAGGFGTAILPNLAKLLRSDYDDVVERSLRALSRVSSPQVVPLAAPYITARFSSWRTAAAKALAASGSVDALPHLRLLSDDPHPSVRQAIASFADSFPPGEAQELLARLARDEDDAVARRALHNLAKDAAGVSYLAEYLREDVAPLGDMAIDLLVKKRTPAALNVLIDALARGEARFRSALQAGVAAFGPTGVTALFDASLKDQRLKVDARALLVQFPNLALKLVEPLVIRNPSDVDTALIDTLGRAKAVGSLAIMDHVFAAGSLSGKVAVAKAWAYYPAANVANRVLGAVRHSDPMVRREAAISGSKAGVRELAPILSHALEDNSLDADVVVMALARLKDGAIEAYMLERFRDSDASMRMRLAVLHACKELQTPECIRTLYSAANDANLTIRHEALLLLRGDDRLAQL